MTAFDYGIITLLIVFMIANWFVPRRRGVAGMLCVQFALVITYFAIACIATSLDRYEYDGLLSIIGLVFQAFLLNALLLPIALAALWRRRREIQTAAQQGFPVLPIYASATPNPRACPPSVACGFADQKSPNAKL